MVQAVVGISPGAGYFSLLKIIVMLVAVVPWLCAAPWVHKDAHRVRAPQAVWSASVLGAGAVGVLIWLLIPFYLAGLIVYVLLTALVLGIYVAYRNGRVEEGAKILTSRHLLSLFKRRESSQVEVISRVKLYNCNGKAALPPNPEQSSPADREAYNLTQDLLYDLIWRRASEADVSPTGQSARLRFVIDGVVIDRPAVSLPESEAIIQYIKPLAGMDLEERRRPQKGKITVDLAGMPIDMTLTATGTTSGQRLHFRIVQEAIRTQIEELGMSEDVLEHLRAMSKMGNGIIIVSGRPGSGVTSTLYSLLRDCDAFIKQLVTLESKIAVDLENVTQQEYGEASQLPGALTSALRRDPDVLMVDRCPEANTAAIINEAAANKNFLLGMQAGDAFVALAKWVKVCGGPAEAVEHLHGVLCQILLRKLCPKCRESYHPDRQLLAKANLPVKQTDTFFRPPTQPITDEKGHPIICSVCQGSGYLERTAAFELLEITDELRRLIVSGASVSTIKAASRKNKMLYLQEQALRKVLAGTTSVQEVIRVSQSSKR